MSTSSAARRVSVLARQTSAALVAHPVVAPTSSGTRLFSSGEPPGQGTSTTTHPSPPSPPHTPQEMSPKSMSFIDRVKVYGAQALVGRLVSSDRFDRVLDGLEVTSINTTLGTVDCELEITNAISNTYGTLHGGAIATIVDVVGTMALLTKDPLRPGVSVDINVTYLAAAKKGSKVIITGTTLKTGKKLGFSEVHIKSLDGATLYATGRHTKAL